MSSYYSEEELAALGLARYGRNVLLSRKTSLYDVGRIEIGNNVRIDDFSMHIHIGAYCGLFASEGIVLEDYVGISSRASIYTVSDDFLGMGLTGPTIPARYLHQQRAPVTLEKHVIVGAGSIVLPGVRIETGAAIGALSLVNSDCKPWKIYVGAPVRAKKDRRSDIILRYQAELEREERAQSGA
jgi:dTDP-4-amino-4,6-dideoxy-D-glucose acyltransferase